MKTILVVEDELKSRLALCNKIKKLVGDDVLVAAADNGKTAIDQALKLNPVFIFMDIEMPLRNGLEVAKVISPYLPDTKVIFLTAYDRFDYAVSAMRSGGKDYLLKPISESDLKAVLSTYLKCSMKDEDAKKEAFEEDVPFQRSIRVWINTHYMEDIGIDDASRAIGISPYYFSRKFKELFGKTFLEYLINYRMDKAKRLLVTTDLTVAEIGEQVGYEDPNYFMKAFKKHLDMTPTQYRRLVQHEQKSE